MSKISSKIQRIRKNHEHYNRIGIDPYKKFRVVYGHDQAIYVTDPAGFRLLGYKFWYDGQEGSTTETGETTSEISAE